MTVGAVSDVTIGVSDVSNVSQRLADHHASNNSLPVSRNNERGEREGERELPKGVQWEKKKKED